MRRDWRGGSVLILDREHPNPDLTRGILQCVGGSLHGRIEGLISAVSPEHPKAEEVWWAEAVRFDVDEIDGRFWLVLKPDVWIWPKHARQQATSFLDERLGNRFNNRGDALLSAWINRNELARQIFDAIGKLTLHRSEFDVLLMYLPNSWEACFESPGFDLHDFLKAFCAPTRIPIQIVLESALLRAARM